MYVVEGEKLKNAVELIRHFTNDLYLKFMDGKLMASFLDPAKVVFIKYWIDVKEHDDDTFDIIVDAELLYKFTKMVEKDDVKITAQGTMYIFETHDHELTVLQVHSEFAKFVDRDPNIGFNRSVTFDAKVLKDYIKGLDKSEPAVRFNYIPHVGLYLMNRSKTYSIKTVIAKNLDWDEEFTVSIPRDYLEDLIKKVTGELTIYFSGDSMPVKLVTDSYECIIAPRIEYE